MRNPFRTRLDSRALPLLGPAAGQSIQTQLDEPIVEALALVGPPKVREGLPAHALPGTHAYGFPGQPNLAGAKAVPELAVWTKALPVPAIAPPSAHVEAVLFSPGLNEMGLLEALPKVHVAAAWMQSRPMLRLAAPIGRVKAEVAERWLKKLASVKRLDRRGLVLEALFEGVAVAEDTPLSYRAGERSLSYVPPAKALPPSVVVVAYDEKLGARVVGRFNA